MTAKDAAVPRAPKVALLGGGRLGRAVAQVLTKGGAAVTLWARRELLRAQVKNEVPGVQVTACLEDAAREAEVVFFAVPTPALFEVAAAYGAVATGDQLVLHACRGVAASEDGFVLPHQAIRSASCAKKVGVLGGPLYVEDLDSGRPIVAIVGSRYDELAEALRLVVPQRAVKLHATRDLVGVEVAGAISNVAALGAGMADGLELGETARGVVLTHGLSDATRLGLVLGAEVATFAGLAGVGDLIPRNISSTRRNERVGRLLALGRSPEDALREAQGDVEGVVTAEQACRLARRYGLDVPLVEAVADVCAGRAPAKDALERVLASDIELGAELTR